jgi:5-methylcytosine-specific restriction endonuclease McrA
VPEPYSRNPNTACTVCGESIYRRPIEIQRGRVFCGSECYGKANRKEKPCVICKTPILASANKKTCSRRCANINRAGIKYGIKRPYDKVRQQRTIKLRVLEVRGGICQRCGYSKKEILHVHHKDRNRNNNTLENLELICPNCHYEEHYLEKSWLNGKVSHQGRSGRVGLSRWS